MELSTFVGRRAELQSVLDRLDVARLVTLIGPGGMGKTSLARQVATALLRTAQPDIVRWVSLSALAPTAEPAMLEQTVADACGVKDFSNISPWTSLLEVLSGHSSLVVLDTCEHVVEHLGQLVSDLLRAVPDLRILTTSQVCLGIEGERLVGVGPLPYPHADDPADSSYPSVELLEARAADLGIVLADAQRPAARELCRRLQGNPLAIVLAAGRMKHLSLDEIARGISGPCGVPEHRDQRLRLLVGGPRHGSHPMHHSLRAAVDWSVGLCSEPERVLLARCSVFADNWDLADVRAVCTGGDVHVDDLPGLLERLVDLQLVHADTSGTVTVYSLPETIRIYGNELIRQYDEWQAIRLRHRDHYRDLAGQAAREWFSDQETRWLEWCRYAMPNLRAALEFSLTTPGHASSGLDIAVNLARLRSPYFLGSLREGRDMLERAVAAVETTAAPVDEPAQQAMLAARALAGWIALCQGDQDGARRYHDQLVGVIADPSLGVHGPPPVLFLAGAFQLLVDHDPAAIALLGAAREAFATDRSQWSGDEAMAELIEAMAAAFVGDRTDALRITQRCMDTAAASGAQWAVSWSLLVRGLALMRHGDPVAAVTLERESLRRQREISDRWGVVWSELAVAWALAAQLRSGTLAAADGAIDAATTIALLLGGAQMLRRLTGVRLEGLAPFAAATAQAQRVAVSVLPGRAYERVYERGAVLSWDHVLDVAMGEGLPISPMTRQWHTLTPAETEVALMVAEGLANQQIAHLRHCSVRTVESHVRQVLDKLALGSRTGVLPWLVAADLTYLIDTVREGTS